MNQHPQRQPAARADSDGNDRRRGAQARRKSDGCHERPARRHRDAKPNWCAPANCARRWRSKPERPSCRAATSARSPHLKASQKYLHADRAGTVDHAAPASRHVSRHAADQSHGARHRACGVREHRARRQHRNPAAQYSQYLYGGQGTDARRRGRATTRRWRSAARSEPFQRRIACDSYIFRSLKS